MTLRLDATMNLWLVIFLLFFLLSGLQGEILAWRGLPPQIVLKPGEFALLIALGGLRGVAADLLYLKADELWQAGKWEQMVPLYRAISILQPHYVDYWSIAGFHIGWNLSFGAKSQEEKEKYIQMGIACLKEGLSHNPDIYRLYAELGLIYEHKLRDYDEAIKWYKKAVSFQAHPQYLERSVAHNLRKKGDLEAARQEWLRLKGLHTDDDYHREIVAKNLKLVEEEIKKSDKKN